MTLFGNRVFADITEHLVMKLSWVGMYGLNPVTGVLTEGDLENHMHRKEGSIKTEAEIGVIFSQTRKHLGLRQETDGPTG